VFCSMEFSLFVTAMPNTFFDVLNYTVPIIGYVVCGDTS
jgi:hypothetical protein